MCHFLTLDNVFATSRDSTAVPLGQNFGGGVGIEKAVLMNQHSSLRFFCCCCFVTRCKESAFLPSLENIRAFAQQPFQAGIEIAGLQSLCFLSRVGNEELPGNLPWVCVAAT